MTEQEQIDYIHARVGNKWWRLNNLYKVENEDGDLVTFKLRPAQALLFKLMAHKNIILKARQLGFSTAIDIYLLDEALFNKNIKCGIIAQDQGAAGEIFRTKIEVPFDNLPEWLKAEFPIKARRSGASGGFILFESGSSIQCATSFRSGTVQRLHISEHGKICAKYPQKAKEVKTGTLNAIHQKAICFIESTAEGVGGDFYSMSMRALDLYNSGSALGSQDYKFHFFAWFQDPKYSEPLPQSGLQLSKYHQEYFAAVESAMKVTLTDEQKQWYINKEQSQGEEIKQEFPSTPQEAFLTSGRRVFDAIRVMNAEAHTMKPLIIYDIEPVNGTKKKAQSMREVDNEKLQRNLLNMLLVWELPDADEEYAIGVDIAEGLEHNDRSSFDVVKKSTGEQVAHWFGHLDVEMFASLVRHVGHMYNTAFVGPERNNHGHAFLQKFRDIYPVRCIYQEQYLDRDNDNDTPKLGWLTTKQSKPIIIEGLKELLRTQTSGIRWIGTISELNAYVYDSKGAMNAQVGCYDDQLISYAIAQEMRARMPKRIKSDDNQSAKDKHWMTY
ncbi:terminase [Photobacterium phosphoreum]|uniref:Terminase n=1 Tax=Photobacterium phosphoreum TaxID=659 RepID=A0A2T3JBD8_PHOPO|nr:terminase [Photobacterium phosphoreum]PSU19613.1 terminase [Photobacterium phosphoreum]PSU36791.1 terminase [Photobacterium phosphoreum]PSU46150.1 terminase [Photobacterium phosphoreum]